MAGYAYAGGPGTLSRPGGNGRDPVDLIEQILSIVIGAVLLVVIFWLIGTSLKGCMTVIAAIVVFIIVFLLVTGALSGGDLENIVVSLPQIWPSATVPELAGVCPLTPACLG